MIRDIPTSERPRERVLKFGVESLSNSELLSIVLRCGTREKSVKDLSLEIISMVGDISNFKDLTLNKLLSIKGIGYVKAIELISVVELSKRIYASNDKKLIKINSSKDVFCF